MILMNREEQTRKERRRLRDQLSAATQAAQLVGNSLALRRLRAWVAKAAQSDAPALITGETGTGKELVARLLHELGPRRERAMVSLNCTGLKEPAIELELFGSQGEAASASSDGLLARAHRGTLLLNDVHQLSPLLQGRLLRLLRESAGRSEEGGGGVAMDVRLVTACDENLSRCVQSGAFQRELLFRLNVLPIHIPPLRQRREDVALLTRYFIDTLCQVQGREPMRIEPGVWRCLGQHDWPGNVRELRNLCQRAVAISDDGVFDTDVLQLSATFEPGSASSSRAGACESSGDATAMARRSGPAEPVEGAGEETMPPAGFDEAKATVERHYVLRALGSHQGNISRAARDLGISRTTLYAKARKFGIDLPRQRPARKS